MFNYKYYYQGSGIWIATKNKVENTNPFFANEIEKSKMKFPYKITSARCYTYCLGVFTYDDIKNRNYNREVTKEDFIVVGDSEYCCTKMQLAIDYIDSKRESSYCIRVDTRSGVMIIHNGNGTIFIGGTSTYEY